MESRNFENVLVAREKNDKNGNPIFRCFGFNSNNNHYIEFYVKSYKANSGIYRNVSVDLVEKRGKYWVQGSNIF